MFVRITNLFIGLSIVGCAAISCAEQRLEPKAFPSAVGYGAVAKGGRGGSVYEVTNLNDSGPGSLRDCVERTEPRTCVFRVAGTIELKSRLQIRRGYLTVAGQTAPGQGIQIKWAPNPKMAWQPLSIGDPAAAIPLGQRAHDIIIRNIKIRPGWNPLGGTPQWNRDAADAVSTERAYNLYFDHVDMMWAADENFNSHQVPSYNITIANSILAEGLRHHSKGGLTCSNGWDKPGCHSITWVRNLFHSNDNRNPSIPGSEYGCIDFINNIISNQGGRGTEIWDNRQTTLVNIVGNVYKKGPSASTVGGIISAGIFISNWSLNYDSRVYAADNIAVGYALFDPLGVRPNSAMPVCPLSTTPLPHAEAMEEVYAEVGAWPRDEVSTRIITESRTGDGGSIPSWADRNPLQTQIWPKYEQAIPPLDRDHDGMPDRWEIAHNLNPSDPDDRNGDFDTDGYTNLEEYLEDRAVQIIGSDHN